MGETCAYRHGKRYGATVPRGMHPRGAVGAPLPGVGHTATMEQHPLYRLPAKVHLKHQPETGILQSSHRVTFSVGASVRRGGIEASSFLLPHQLLRRRYLNSNRSPQMQTVIMQVDVLALFRVILNDYVFLVPEQIFDEAHLAPVRAAVRQGAE